MAAPISAFDLFTHAVAAADDILKTVFRVDVRKALDPLDPSDFLVISSKLSSALANVSRDAEAAALRAALDRLDVDWRRLSPAGIDRIVDASKAVLNPAPTVVPTIQNVFVAAASAIGPASKRAAAVNIPTSLGVKWNARDERVTQAIAFSQGNFVRDEYGRRATSFGVKAKQIVVSGIERGLDRWDIAKELQTQLQGLGRSDNYWTLIAGTFANRARTYASLSGFADCGITHYIFESILDQKTSVVCRFMHGRRFEVGHALARAAQVEELEDPQDIKFVTPWLNVGRDGDGNPSLYYKTASGGREHVGGILESGAGEIDATGKFSNAMTDAELSQRGIMMPPCHGHCRSTIVADAETVSSGGSSGGGAPPIAGPEPPSPEPPAPPGLGAKASRAWAALNGLEAAGEGGAEIALTEALPARALPREGELPPWADALEAARIKQTRNTYENDPQAGASYLFQAYGQLGKAPYGEIKASKRTVPRGLVEREIQKHSAEKPRDSDYIRTVRFGGRLFVYDDGSGSEHAKVVADKLLGRKDLKVRVLDLDQMVGAPAAPRAPAKGDEAHNKAVRAMGSKLGAALKDIGVGDDTEAQRAARQSVRDYLRQTYGVASHDIEQNRASAFSYATANKRGLAHALGTHGWDGKITVRDEIHRQAKDAAVALGSKTGLDDLRQNFAANPRATESTLKGLRVLFHEEFHGHSPVMGGAYASYGIGLEEAKTEILARRAMRDILAIKGGATDPASAFALPIKNAAGEYEGKKVRSYDHYISALFNTVAAHTGDADIHARIEAAVMATRSDASKRYNRPVEAARGFVDALGISGAQASALVQDLTSKARLWPGS